MAGEKEIGREREKERQRVSDKGNKMEIVGEGNIEKERYKMGKWK